MSSRVIQSAISGRARVNGKHIVALGSNNYRGLANHPIVLDAFCQGVRRYGAGTGMTPPLATTLAHQQLEQALAEFHQTEAAMVFSSCTAANFALLDTVTTADDVIFSDELNHASIIDGCRLSRARVVKVKHCSAESFLQGLEQSSSAKSQRRKLLITDGVFSMEGYTAPLPQFLEATTGSDTMLAIDESHAAGVVGKTGRGSAELHDCMDKIDYFTGTLSKAFGAVGGGYISLLHQHALATNRVQHLQQETPHQLLRRNARPATFRVSPYIRANTSSMYLSASLSHEGSDATDGPAME